MKTRALAYCLIFIALIFQSCEYDNDSLDYGTDTGTGGSMARFTIVDSNLYTVDRTNLKVFDLEEASLPEFKADIPVGLDIETIFPFVKAI